MPLLKRAEPSQVATIINAYWLGIAAVLPEPFATSASPADWVIQKGPGATALHSILPQVIETIRAKGQPLGDPSAYAEVLENLPTLTGDTVTEDGQFVQTLRRRVLEGRLRRVRLHRRLRPQAPRSPNPDGYPPSQRDQINL